MPATTIQKSLEEILEHVSTLKELSPESRGFPSTVRPTTFGKGLYAKADLAPGTVVEKFEGREVDYATVYGDYKNYVLNYDKDGSKKYEGWLYVTSAAKYANHSCNPNCEIVGTFDIVTTREVKEGDELTFFYNEGSQYDEWDSAWTFQCQCGASNCQGLLDRYRERPPVK